MESPLPLLSAQELKVFLPLFITEEKQKIDPTMEVTGQTTNLKSRERQGTAKRETRQSICLPETDAAKYPKSE